MKCLLLCFGILMGSIPGFADDDLNTYTVDETVVTATKQEDAVENVPQPVTIISADDIADRHAYNAGEMLDYVPGVRVIRTGSVGASNGISIRSLNGGPGSNKTLVLVDGRPVNDAWSGGVNWHSIPSELIERIEVVRGPGSALYGSQASAGVVSVFTKKPAEGFHGWFTIGHEFDMGEDVDNGKEGYGRPEIGATRLGLNGSYATESTSHFMSFGYRDAKQSFPTPNENKWDNYDIFYKVNHEFSNELSSQLTVDLHSNTWDNEADRAPSENTTDNVAVDVSTRWQKGPGVLNSRLYVNRAENENKVPGTGLTTGETALRSGFIADYSMPLNERMMLVAGFDAHYDDAEVDADKSVVSMTSRGVETVSVYNSRSGKYETFDADTFNGRYGPTNQTFDESNVALFGQVTSSLTDRLNLVAGGRFDIHSEFGSVFNPKAGLTYDVYEQGGMKTTLKVNYGTAFRAPPMVALFSKSVGSYGDDDLDPEKTKNTDIGIFQRFGKFGTAELTFFHMDVTDLLINDNMGSTGEGYYVFVPTEAGVDTVSFKQRMNLGSYSPKGVEFGFRLTPHKQVAFSGAYTYLDPGDFTFQTSKNRFNLGLSGFVPFGENRVEAEVNYNHTGDGYFFDYETRPYDAFGLTNARLTYDYAGKYRVSLNVKNIADTKYRLWHYAWQPGRTVSVAVESRF